MEQQKKTERVFIWDTLISSVEILVMFYNFWIKSENGAKA